MKRRDFLQSTLGAILGGSFVAGCNSGSSSGGGLPPASAAPSGQPFAFPATPYTLRVTPLGIDVWFPTWITDHASWTPAWEAAVLKEVDETPNQFGAKTIHDAPGKWTVVIGPVKGFYWPSGPFVAGLALLALGIVVCAWKAESGQQPVNLPSYAHELAHVHGWPGNHPATCPTCHAIEI